MVTFIDYLLSFNFEIYYAFGQYPHGKPIFSKPKMTWEFDKDSHARNFYIRKESYSEHNIPYLIISEGSLSYHEYLKKMLHEFKAEIQKHKSESIMDYNFATDLKKHIKNLGRAISRYEKKQICFNPDKTADNYYEELLWHKDIKIQYCNILYESDPSKSSSTNPGFVKYVISLLIDSQKLITEDTIDFLNNELANVNLASIDSNLDENETLNKISIQVDDDAENIPPLIRVKNKKFTKIRFLDDTNVLVTLFHDLREKEYIYTSPTNLENFILSGFSDKNGNPLKKETVHTILKPSREDKRALNDKRIPVPTRK